jgi:alanine racemase
MTSNGLTNRRCWVEVDLDALRANLAWIKHRVGPGVRVMTVVKADAYGHGLKSIAALLMQSGTDVFGVASLSEADSIRSVGKGWPVLLLGAALPDEIEYAIRDGVMLTLSSAEQLHQVAKVAQKLGVVASIHLKVDTGMGRLGVAPELAPALAAEARSTPGIKLAGLYTHYASVEERRRRSPKTSDRAFARFARRCVPPAAIRNGCIARTALGSCSSCRTVATPCALDCSCMA